MNKVFEGLEYIVLTSPQQLNHYVYALLLEAFSKNGGNIDLLLQPDYPFLFSLLSSLTPVGKVNIRHIFCLNDTPDFMENHELRSLYYIRQIFPVYMNRVNYEPFYFYDRIDAHFHSLNMLPCLILTNQAAILCTSDYQAGLYLRNPETIFLFQNLFCGYLNRCTAPFSVTKIIPDNYFSVVRSVYDLTNGANLIVLEPEACLQPFLSDDLLDKIINRSFPQAEILLDVAKKTFQLHRLRLAANKLRIYFTKEGLSHFAKTGLIAEIPELFYHPLTRKQRITVLNQVLSCCRKGSYRMLRNPLNRLPENLHLFIRGQDLCDLSYNSSDGSAVLLSVRESGLLDAFQDYFASLNPEHFYSPDEAAASISAMISELKESVD